MTLLKKNMKSSIKKRIVSTTSGICMGWKVGRRHKLTLKNRKDLGKRRLSVANQKRIKAMLGN